MECAKRFIIQRTFKKSICYFKGWVYDDTLGRDTAEYTKDVTQSCIWFESIAPEAFIAEKLSKQEQHSVIPYPEEKS